MKKWNYYNDIDPRNAAWTKQLIKDKLVPDGEIDTRSILEVQPSDLSDFVQCHFFCGILGWPLALQLAGWPSDKPVWTGSCPCQPFSSAGKQLAQADARHLWPAFFRLIAQCRPEFVIGEQVATAVGKGWLDGVSADLGSEGYSCGSAVLGAHSVGADHIRQRLYWMANNNSAGLERSVGSQLQTGIDGSARDGETNWLADSNLQRRSGIDPLLRGQARGRNEQDFLEAARSGESIGLVQPGQPGLEGHTRNGDDRNEPRWLDAPETRPAPEASDFMFLPCRDGKTRRTQSGIFPLVNGIPRGVVPSGDPSCPSYANATPEARSMRLHGYGNAIHPGLAAEFIQAYVEVTQL